MLIGIFVVAASAIVVFVMMFIHPTVGDETLLLRVRFADIDKITVGTRVNFAGKPVGEVVEIRELPDVDVERKEVNGYVYVYELTLRVDSGIKIFNTDTVSARSSGLLGDKSVAITPRAPKKGEELRIVNDEVIYATETGSVEETLKELKALSNKIEGALDNVDEAFTALREKKFWDNLGSSMSHINDITDALNKPKILSETIANVHKATDDAVKFASDAVKVAADARTVSNKIVKGEGTVGKLVSKDDLYVRFVALTNKAETVMNDVNHYGVLFHLDKGWQRLRARRMNLMQRLSSPQEFRNYFNDEVDQISTSVTRVSDVLQKLNNLSLTGCYNMMQDPEFVKVYGELMRRVSSIEESVKMYNQQVADSALFETELCQ